VTARIVEPRLGAYDDREASEDLGEQRTMEPVSRSRRQGLLAWAGLSALLISARDRRRRGPAVPGSGWLAARLGRAAQPDPTATGPEAFRPLLRSVVTMIVIFFVVPGFVYGRVVGTMRTTAT
jgi:aminobenzoyl-glutamate transport protein